MGRWDDRAQELRETLASLRERLTALEEKVKPVKEKIESLQNSIKAETQEIVRLGDEIHKIQTWRLQVAESQALAEKIFKKEIKNVWIEREPYVKTYYQIITEEYAKRRMRERAKGSAKPRLVTVTEVNPVTENTFNFRMYDEKERKTYLARVTNFNSEVNRPYYTIAREH